MKLIITISMFLAHSLLAKALPNPVNQGFSVEIVKRRLPDAFLDLEKRGVQNGIDVTNVSLVQDKWTVDLIVGGQKLPTTLDTGSQDIWYESNQEQSTMTGGNHPLYTPTPTNSIPSSSWVASFDSGYTAAAGVAYYETITIGTASVTNQVVGAATSVAAKNFDKKSGIVGLSPYSNQSNYVGGGTAPPSLMSNLQTQLRVTKFALDLRYDSGSRLDFGFINSSRFTGPLTYGSIGGSPSWMIRLDGVYYVNGKNYTGAMSDSSGQTMVDSGAPWMRFPPTVVRNYYNSSVPGYASDGGGYYFNCSLVRDGKLPSFGVSLNGVVFAVPSSWMWSYQSVRNSSNCYGSLQETSGYSYLGDMFLRTVFAVFDTQYPSGPGQVGLATKRLPTRPSPV